MHFEKAPLILSAIVSVVLGVGATWLFPSAELLALREQAVELERTQRMIAPVMRLAKQTFPSVGREEALRRLVSRVTELESQTSGLQSYKAGIEAEKHAAQLLRETPPDIEGWLERDPTGRLYVNIHAKNLVPFRVRYWVQTKDKTGPGGLMLESMDLYPTVEKTRWRFKHEIVPNKVIDGYLELSLKWSSVYSAELGNPPSHQGLYVRKYHYTSGDLTELKE